jgi:hypothetical protein
MKGKVLLLNQASVLLPKESGHFHVTSLPGSHPEYERKSAFTQPGIRATPKRIRTLPSRNLQASLDPKNLSHKSPPAITMSAIDRHQLIAIADRLDALIHHQQMVINQGHEDLNYAATPAIQSYKVAMVGGPSVGKTPFGTRLLGARGR